MNRLKGDRDAIYIDHRLPHSFDNYSSYMAFHNQEKYT